MHLRCKNNRHVVIIVLQCSCDVKWMHEAENKEENNDL